jgi:hypothetical protein
MKKNKVMQNKFLTPKGLSLMLIIAGSTLNAGCSMDEIIESISGITSNLTGGGGGGGGGNACPENQICFFID